MRNTAGSCTCIEDYEGDPYVGCYPECILNQDCPHNKACRRNKCEDPCPGLCGISMYLYIIQNEFSCNTIKTVFIECIVCLIVYILFIDAICEVYNHVPTCKCLEGYTGQPFQGCHLVPKKEIPYLPPPSNPCQPSPCGNYAQCRELNGAAICSCLSDYIGNPPSCRPECTSSAECPLNRACINQKCVDPCPGPCAVSAECRVVNHSPICVCPDGMEGDPFISCTLKRTPPPKVQTNPCVPNPCGQYSECREINGLAACSCQPGYVGSPPNCHPECTIDPDCSTDKACLREKCRDPCPGACGYNAECRALSHKPRCFCLQGFTGDPFRGCSQIPPPPPVSIVKETLDPCHPSPCGANAGKSWLVLLCYEGETEYH